MQDRASARAKEPRCPACGWKDVRHSKARGFLDRLARMFGRVPYRCRSCGKRFYHAEQEE